VAAVAVLLAALGVFGTGTGWPDLIVATVMALLALQGGPRWFSLIRKPSYARARAKGRWEPVENADRTKRRAG
jgi:hypothetical protein